MMYLIRIKCCEVERTDGKWKYMYVSKLYSYKLVGRVEFRVEINIIYESEIIPHRWTLLKLKKNTYASVF